MPAGLRTWRSSSPRTLRRSASDCGGRCAMPTRARSGSTKRTGWSISRGPPLAPRGQGLGDAHGLAAELARLLDAPPGLVGIAAHDAAAPKLLALRLGPAQTARLGERLAQVVVDVQQVAHVGRRVLELVAVDRAPQPVGQPVAFGEPDPEHALDQRAQRGRAEPGEPGRHLGVEHRRRDGARLLLEHLEVLPGRMHDGDAGPFEHVSQRAQRDRQRVDEHEVARPRDLDERDAGEERPLPVELRVDGVGRLVREPGHDVGEAVGLVDPTRLDAPVSAGGSVRIRCRFPRGRPRRGSRLRPRPCFRPRR